MANGELPRQLDRKPLVEQVAQLLNERIADGSWPVGTRIPTETQLVEWVGAGRNTVREAVGSLVRAGVLHREQGRGTFVVATSELDSPLARRVARTERTDVLELRLALDAAAARIAARRRTDAEATALLELLEARARSWQATDLTARAAADTELHLGIVAATHNPLLQDVYRPLAAVFEDVALDDVHAGHDALGGVHRELVAAISEREPERAADAMYRLLRPLLDQVATD